MADITGQLQAAAGAGGAAEETDPNFNQTVLLLHGDGSDGAQNNTFLDSSSNNFTITRNGNATQGTFSPFSAPDGEWSNYFDGSGDRLSWSGSTVGTNAFSFECWIYLNSVAEYATLGSTNTSGGLTVRVKTSTSIAIDALNVSGVNYTVPTITANTWHHLVACRNASNETTVFWNGVRSSSGVQTDTRNFAVSNLIGAVQRASVEIQLNGYLSNARLVIGSSAYDPTQTTITVPTAPLTAITNTSLLTCQSNRFVDNSTNNFAITPIGNTKVTSFAPFAPTAAYDASVNGGSGYFDGNDHLNLSDSALVATGDFTLEAWCYTTRSNAYQGIISLGNSTNTSGVRITQSNTGKLEFWINGQVNAATALPLNQWNHVALVRAGSASNNVSCYLNGVRLAQLTQTTSTTQSDCVIGRYYNGGTNQYHWLGYIASARMVVGTALYSGTTITVPTAPSTAVSGTELLCNFTNAGIFDNTGKNNLETVADAQIDTNTKVFGTGSMEFPGTNDYLTVSGTTSDYIWLHDKNTDYTIEFWMYPNSVSGRRAILQTGALSASSGVLLEIDNASLTYSIYRSVSGTFTACNTGSSSVSTGQWYFVSVVVTTTEIKIYFDGVLKNTTTWSLSGSTAAQATIMRIAGDVLSTSIDGFVGFIDDMRITRGVARDGTVVPTKAFPDQ